CALMPCASARHAPTLQRRPPGKTALSTRAANPLPMWWTSCVPTTVAPCAYPWQPAACLYRGDFRWTTCPLHCVVWRPACPSRCAATRHGSYPSTCHRPEPSDALAANTLQSSADLLEYWTLPNSLHIATWPI